MQIHRNFLDHGHDDAHHGKAEDSHHEHGHDHGKSCDSHEHGHDHGKSCDEKHDDHSHEVRYDFEEGLLTLYGIIYLTILHLFFNSMDIRNTRNTHMR